jgi:nicotinamide-nucleotide amidase
MDTEIITIGDELVTGHTLDTNAALIARQVTDLGFNVRYQTSVGDSQEAMEEVFRLALKRARLVITTGGLGPTDDDVTKKAIVRVFKRNLIFHQEILDDIRARYAQRGIEMPAINQNQALLPQGATLFPNKHGSAVGLCIAEEGRIFIALPGVPAEAEQVLLDEVIPYLKGLRSSQATKIIKLRTTGIYESRLAELLGHEFKLETGVRLAYLPAYSGVDLRVMATGENPQEAGDKALRLVRHLEETCGRYIYGRDDDTLEGVVGQLLADNDKTLAVAESCTGGELGMLITSVSGSSGYFVGGVIAYSNDVKIEQLGVDAEIIEKRGAVSEPCAIALAVGCRQLMNSSYALSITGIAGPTGGTEDKPVGTTFIGLASAHASYARKFNFGERRDTGRARASYAALELLRREMLDIK